MKGAYDRDEPKRSRAKLTAEDKETARKLRGKTIKAIQLNPFDPCWAGHEGEAVTDPVIVFKDGTCLRFMVEETETGEYGVKLVYPARAP